MSISTAAALLQSGGLEYCLALLENLLEHWKKLSPEQVCYEGGGLWTLVQPGKGRRAAAPPALFWLHYCLCYFISKDGCADGAAAYQGGGLPSLRHYL